MSRKAAYASNRAYALIVPQLVWASAPPRRVLKQNRYFFFQIRNFLLHDFPQQIKINSEIFMNQIITGAGNFSPWNLRMLHSKIIGDVFCRLADNSDPVNQFVLQTNIRTECFLGNALCVFFDKGNAVKYVLKKNFRIFLHIFYSIETISSSAYGRMSGSKELNVPISPCFSARNRAKNSRSDDSLTF